jgi:hypothetical protein
MDKLAVVKIAATRRLLACRGNRSDQDAQVTHGLNQFWIGNINRLRLFFRNTCGLIVLENRPTSDVSP